MITDIDKIIKKLPKEKRKLFNKIFKVSVTKGKVVPPKEMYSWIKNQFGSVKNVKSQKIVKIDNIITNEGTLFNWLRSMKPMEMSKEMPDLSKKDPFCTPLKLTPEDVFGRIKGKHCITASNIAKYDGFHGLIIFNKHNPLDFNKEEVADYIDTGFKWFKAANKEDKKAIYPLLMWNCLWKAAAGVVHGHMQVSLTRKRHYNKVEFLRKVAKKYKGNYFEDLFKIHKELGLGLEYKGIKVMANLTPIKEKETILISNNLNNNLEEAIHKVLRCLIDKLGVQSFNMAILIKPMKDVKGWENFPIIVRIVDRGKLNFKTCDMGCMEVYSGNSIVASDPFKVFDELKRCLK